MVIGGEFFNSNPESPLTHLVFKLDDIKGHCLDARTALSTLTGTELQTKAQDLGRLDSMSGMHIYIDVSLVGHRLMFPPSTQDRKGCLAVPR